MGNHSRLRQDRSHAPPPIQLFKDKADSCISYIAAQNSSFLSHMRSESSRCPVEIQEARRRCCQGKKGGWACPGKTLFAARIDRGERRGHLSCDCREDNMKPKLVLWLVVAMGALTVVTSAASHWLLRTHALDYAGRDLQRLAQEVAYELDRQVVEWGRDINQLGDVLSGMRYDGDGERWSLQLQRYQMIHPRYRWIGVLNDMGRVVAATNPATIQSELRHTYLVENPDTVQARNIYDIQSDILSGRAKRGGSETHDDRRKPDRCRQEVSWTLSLAG